MIHLSVQCRGDVTPQWNADDGASCRCATRPDCPGYPADLTNSFNHDALGRMTQLVQSGTAATGQPGISRKRVDIAYNTAGQFDEIIRSVGAAGSETEVATGDYSYFDGGGLQEIAYSHSGATLTTPDFPTGLPAGNALSTYSWTYDSAGRVASFTAPEGTFSYGYDNTHQITSADYSVASGYTGYQPDDESWQWDATGNVDDGETIDGNRDTTIGDAQYYYDDDGNIVWESPVGDSSKRLSFYDVRDRLVRVEDYDTNNNLTQMVLFTYDAFDRRVLKRVDSNADGTVDTTERYVWDGDEVVMVLDESGNVEHRFLHGPGIDQVFADESAADGLLWYLTDNQNTVRDVAKDDGTGTVEVVNHLTYSTFGKILSETNPNDGHSDASDLTPFFAYTGRDWDEDIQLQYNRARWYDPDMGRWRSEDPIRWAAGDENLYRYVGNSPTNFIDPSGLANAALPSSIPWSGITPEQDVANLEVQSAAMVNGNAQAVQALFTLGEKSDIEIVPVPEGARDHYELELKGHRVLGEINVGVATGAASTASKRPRLGKILRTCLPGR